MNLEELRVFLESCTGKTLKEICSNTRSPGVYRSSTCYAGYSKCRNKKELIELMMKRLSHFQEPKGTYYQDKGDQWSYVITYRDYQFNPDHPYIDIKTLFTVIFQKLVDPLTDWREHSYLKYTWIPREESIS